MAEETQINYINPSDIPSLVETQGREALKGRGIKCLDHGYVALADFMGDDYSIVQAARTSYGKGTKATRDDRDLIRYLMRHRHTTPFEMVEVKFLTQMPILVARHVLRHRTFNVNEYSLRYSEPIEFFYIPEPEDINIQDKKKRQGRGEVVSPEVAKKVIDFITRTSLTAKEFYQLMKNDDIAIEIARDILPVNWYTRMYLKNDLHNLFHFEGLRMDEHAQWETRQFANAISYFLKALFPNAWEAFEDYRLKSLSFSNGELQLIKRYAKTGLHGLADLVEKHIALLDIIGSQIDKPLKTRNQEKKEATANLYERSFPDISTRLGSGEFSEFKPKLERLLK